MTKKHFIQLADALRATQPGFGSPELTMLRRQWYRDVDAIGGVLAQTNPKFDLVRWKEYIDQELTQAAR